MKYRFSDQKGTFRVEQLPGPGAYFPLTDKDGRLLSSISPNLAGDIKRDNDHFLTPPAGIEDLRSNPLCCREFYLKVGSRTLRLSRPLQDQVEAGFLYHTVSKKALGLRIEVLNFIPADIPAEVMRVRVTNQAARPVAIIPTSCIPLFGRAEKNLRDHRHVSALLNRIALDRFGILLEPTMIFDEKGHRRNQTLYFVKGYEGNGQPPLGQFPTLDYFFGSGDIFAADAIEKDVRPALGHRPEFDGKEAAGALRFRRRILRPGQTAVYVLVMGIADSRQDAQAMFGKLNTPQKVSRALESTRRYWQSYLSRLEIDFKDPLYNNWLRWVRLQPTLRKLFGCSFLPHFDYGKGGRGWRDLWQDALTLLLTEPEKARSIIVKSFQGIRLDGSNATIISRDGSFIADRNRINRVWMDHGVWPFLTTRLYLDRTKDARLLLANQTYFRDHQLKRARETDKNFSQKDFLQRKPDGSLYTGSILEHLLVQHLVQFFNVGDHNAIRLENADWNDGLDMAAHKGESVAFSCMYCHNLRSLCDYLRILKETTKTVLLLKELTLLLDRTREPIDYNSPAQKRRRLEEYFERIRRPGGTRVSVAIDDLISDLEAKARHMSDWLASHEWLPQGFFNGYYDDLGRRVEGRRGAKVRMMLTSQVFAIMSGVASDQQIRRTWQSIRTHLFDKDRQGFRLNTDFGALALELGRAFGFAYGDKENGAFFCHMAVMLGNSLYRRGFVREGKQVLDSIYRMSLAPEAQIYPLIPEYFNSQGRGLYWYLTGSASWYVYTLLEEVLGIKYRRGQLMLEPKLLADDFRAGRIELSVPYRGKKVRIIYERQGHSNKNTPCLIKRVFANRKPVHAGPQPYSLTSSDLLPARPVIKVVLG